MGHRLQFRLQLGIQPLFHPKHINNYCFSNNLQKCLSYCSYILEVRYSGIRNGLYVVFLKASPSNYPNIIQPPYSIFLIINAKSNAL